MDTPGFGAKQVGKRLDVVLSGKGSNDAIAERLKARTGYETSGEKIRKARRGENQTIAHDLLAAVAEVYEIDVAWLLTGRKPAADHSADGDGIAPGGAPGEQQRYRTVKEPTPDEVRAELARYRRAQGEGVGPMWRLVEKVVDSEDGDWRAKRGIVEAIIAAGRVAVSYGESMAAVQRGVVMEAESGAADGRNEVNRIEAEEAARRAYPHGETAPVVPARKPGEEGGQARTGSG